MQQTVSETNGQRSDGSGSVTIRVNNHPVTLSDHKASGLEIKQGAIQQGVSIQENFNLFRVKGGGQLDPIGDAETINLHKDEEFRATAPDDNS
jgi:hypothetical protein